MAELNITRMEDIPKLEGWTIRKASAVPMGIHLIITHPAASTEVSLIITASAQMQVAGGSYTVSPTFLMQSADYKEPEKDNDVADV